MAAMDEKAPQHDDGLGISNQQLKEAVMQPECSEGRSDEAVQLQPPSSAPAPAVTAATTPAKATVQAPNDVPSDMIWETPLNRGGLGEQPIFSALSANGGSPAFPKGRSQTPFGSFSVPCISFSQLQSFAIVGSWLYSCVSCVIIIILLDCWVINVIGDCKWD